jgi:ribonuclease HII
VRDSKLLSSLQRETLFPLICQFSVAVGVGLASASFIDRWGIVKATQRAMLMAVHNLSIVPQYLLVDALHLPDTRLPQQGLIKGDAYVLSISCASVVAKVFRDRCMLALDRYQPGYGFAQHKGYGTAGHRAALAQMGPSPSHRYSFAPLRALTDPNC